MSKSKDRIIVSIVVGTSFVALVLATLLLFAYKELASLPSNTTAEAILEPVYENLAEPYEENAAVEIPVIETEPYICVTDYTTRCYQYPDVSSAIIERYKKHDTVLVAGEEGGFYSCLTSTGEIGYIKKRHLSNTGYEYPFVEVPGAKDLRLLIPSAEFDILFASNRNITGHSLYPAIPIMEDSAADMLLEASKIFESDGYRLKIYDAYRPKSAQFELYDIVQDNRYIANPYTTSSWHNVGRAVDMSLINIETGEELEMPTPMHTFDSTASRFNSNIWTEAARANVQYMTEVMESVGFGTISTEWWHFEYTGPGNVLGKNIDCTKYYIEN